MGLLQYSSTAKERNESEVCRLPVFACLLEWLLRYKNTATTCQLVWVQCHILLKQALFWVKYPSEGVDVCVGVYAHASRSLYAHILQPTC